MKRFKFDLEQILQLRKFREEECKIELGQAISALNFIENKIKETALKRHAAVNLRFQDVKEMSSWENYVTRLDIEAHELTEKAAQAEIIVEQKRELYLEASKELTAIEKLKEKQLFKYKKEKQYEEMLETDELFSARHMIQ